MKLVTTGAEWLCVFGIICLPSEIVCCDSGSYYSLDLHGCLECPQSPVLNCKNEHQHDIRSCLLHCVTGNIYCVLIQAQQLRHQRTFGLLY